jgi:hypothetical protein
MKRAHLFSFITFAVVAGICAFALSGCGYPPDDNPPVYYGYTSVAAAGEAARLHARDLPGGGGQHYLVQPTGSMRPFINDYDCIVVSQKFPYEDLKPGQIIIYVADWLPVGSPVTCHRLVSKDSYGWILTGDNNARTEASWRVTEKTYRGKVIAVYTTREN